MDNIITFPGSIRKDNFSLTPTPEITTTEEDAFQKSGILSVKAAEVVRDELCKTLDEGVKDMVFYAVTEKGRVLVTITKDTDKLTGMLARIQHSLLLNDDVSMDDYTYTPGQHDE